MPHQDGEDAVGGGSSAGRSLGNPGHASSCSGPHVAPAVHRACVFIRGKERAASRPPAPLAQRPSRRGRPSWQWALPGARRASAWEPPERTCVSVKRHAETPGDGNDTVLLSLCCFPCTLVKTWGQSVCDGPNKCLLIRPECVCQAQEKCLARTKMRPPPKKHICLKIGLSIWESTFRLFAPTPCLCRSSRRRGDETKLLFVVGRK